MIPPRTPLEQVAGGLADREVHGRAPPGGQLVGPDDRPIARDMRLVQGDVTTLPSGRG